MGETPGGEQTAQGSIVALSALDNHTRSHANIYAQAHRMSNRISYTVLRLDPVDGLNIIYTVITP